MGDILRRRAMMAAANGGNKPLYSFETRDFLIYQTGSSSAGRSHLQFSDGNHFLYYARNRGDSYQAYADFENTSVSRVTTWPGMFALNAGDELVIKLKNGYVYSNQSASYNGYAQFSLVDSAGTFIGGWTGSASDEPLYVVGKQRKEFTELVYSKTIEADTTAYSFKFCTYGSGQAMYITLDADLEVYVNDVRYI